MTRCDLNNLKVDHWYKYCNVVGGRARICATEERLFGDIGYLRDGDVFLVAEVSEIQTLSGGRTYKVLGPTVVGYVNFTKYGPDHPHVHHAEKL